MYSIKPIKPKITDKPKKVLRTNANDAVYIELFVKQFYAKYGKIMTKLALE